MKKTGKILFFVSFAPAAFLFVMAVASIFTGAAFMFSTFYGFEAFYTTLILGALALCYIPVLPACIVYQVVYIAMYIHSKRKKASPDGEPAAPDPQKEKTKGIILVSLFSVLALSVVGFIAAPHVKEALVHNKAKRMYDAADVKLEYNLNATFYDGVVGIEEQKHSCILVDYDTSRIGIIVAGSNDEYYEFELERMSSPSDFAVREIEKNNYVQTVINIDNGDRLIAYSDERNYITAYMVLYRADGYVYATNLMKDKDGGDVYTDLRGEFDYPGDNVKHDDLILK